MIAGVVNADGEAMLRIVVGDFGTQRIVVDAVIDINGGAVTVKALAG